MTPADEIRAKLDELGIKYTTDDSDDYEVIEWQGPYNLWWQFVYDPYEEEPYGELRLLRAGGSTSIAPAQAIVVTVSAGTCHMKLLENMHTRAYQDMYECDECGEQVLRETYMGKSEPPKFCPNCGRKVVS